MSIPAPIYTRLVIGSLLVCAVHSLGVLKTRAQELVPVADFMHPAEQVHWTGYLAGRLDRAQENGLAQQDIDHLVAPFRNRTETRLWQSEFWGKWVTSAVKAYRYRPEPRLKLQLERAVTGLLATQSADGYIGNYAPESHLAEWDIWGRKYTLLGLLDYHELTGDQQSLQAARRLADHLIQEIEASEDGLIVSKGNYRGMAASSVLEPIIKLYRSTKDSRYLAFACRIVDEWETPQGPQLISKARVDVSRRFPKPSQWYGYEQGQKAYEMMSCYEGLLELYRITGNSSYREAVERTWENIRATEINIAGSGASEEMWFGGYARQTMPITHYQETCVTVTWIKLNLQLFRLTGEARYADEIERSYYNALLGALSTDGTQWAKYTPLNGERLPGSGQCGMDVNCCTASGPRGLFALPSMAVTATPEGPSVNFFIEGTYTLTNVEGQRYAVKVNTDYPESGNLYIAVELPEPKAFTLRLRIPGWSEVSEVLVNDQPVDEVLPGNYVVINRKWTNTDRIVVRLDMRGRVVTHRIGPREFAAIYRGPIVLARDARLAGPPLIAVARPVTDSAGVIDLRPLPQKPDSECWMVFEAPFQPESYTEYGAGPINIQLCDYASAGNGNRPTAFSVWLAQLFSGRKTVKND